MYRLLTNADRDEFRVERHETGPEWIVGMQLLGLIFLKSIAELITAVLKARAEGKAKGDKSRNEVELIVRGLDTDGKVFEHKVLKISVDDRIDKKTIERTLSETIQRTLPPNDMAEQAATTKTKDTATKKSTHRRGPKRASRLQRRARLLRPGSYTITARDLFGKVIGASTVEARVDARRKVYVAADGDPAADGTIAKPTTLTHALATLTDDTEVLLKRGQSFAAGAGWSAKNNVVVSTYGDGDRPVINFTPGVGINWMWQDRAGQGLIIENLTFDTPGITHAADGKPRRHGPVRCGFSSRKNIAVRNC